MRTFVARSPGRVQHASPVAPSAGAVSAARAGHDFSRVRVHADSPADTLRVMRQAKPVETKFSGCPAGQATQIDGAVADARSALNAAASVVAGAYGRPGSVSAVNRQLLLTHFHTTDRDDMRSLLGTYTRVSRAFDAGLKFQCETTCDKTATGVVCGYAYNTMLFGGRGPIHICFDPAGCDFTTTAAINRAALVIHEAAHRHAGVDDKVYQWDPKYANLSASEAMDNADSYAWFAVSV
jgi:hypothetical protein